MAVNQILNLSHLNGQTVSILANGIVLDNKVVSDGKIELGSSYSVVHIGLPMQADLETLRIEVPWREGTMQTKTVKISGVIIKLIQSRGGYIGPTEDELWEAITYDDIVKSSGQNIEEVDLFTGDVRQPLGGQYTNRNGSIFFRQSDPLPVTVGDIVFSTAVGGSVR